MFALVLHKLRSNAWKVVSLLVGSILVVGIATSIPVFSDGILQRMLTQDLKQAQQRGTYPGYLSMRGQNRATLAGQVARLLARMPVRPQVVVGFARTDDVHAQETASTGAAHPFTVGALTDLPAHVVLLQGHMYAPDVVDGIVEVVVTQKTAEQTGVALDRTYDVFSYRQSDTETAPLIRVRVVGVVTSSDDGGLYWYQSPDALSGTLLCDPSVFEGLEAVSPSLYGFYRETVAAYDYHDFRIRDVDALLAADHLGKSFEEITSGALPFHDTFAGVVTAFRDRSARLQLTLEILIVPILLMLAFYLFMVSQWRVQGEAAAMAVLESRGAGRSFILALYALESLLLGAVSLVLGPLLGLGLVRVIGSTSGFLELVHRQPLAVALDGQALLYAGAAVAFTVLTTLLPVFQSSRTSIVQQKRRTSREARPPLWKRFFLDVLLLAAALYAWYQLGAQARLQQTTGLSGGDADLDFLLFLASTLFVLGAGLLFLRVYPTLVRLVFRAGLRFWSPVPYVSLHRISRSSGQEQLLMLFLILALSVGLFDANAARTINRNAEDIQRAQVGADLALQEHWQPYDAEGRKVLLPPGTVATAMEKLSYRYVEPDPERFARLAGVASVARVYRSDQVVVTSRGTQAPVSLMALDPYAFGTTAWTRADLNAYPAYQYLNVMTGLPGAVLLSSDLQATLGVAVGDTVRYSDTNGSSVEGIVVAFIDHWPGFRPTTLDADGRLVVHSLIVGNLSDLLLRNPIHPYQVWLRKADGANDASVYRALSDAGIPLDSVVSATQGIVAAKNDPLLQGTNGAMTVGFLASMLVCALGFLIYWILSVQGRVLQFGVFRAMGLGRGALVGMLLCEQALVSGVAVLVGLFLGNLASWLYVPLYQLAYSSVDQPIPFRVISLPSDALKIDLIVAVLLVACFLVLARFVRRLRIDSALKLGEE